MHGHPNFRLRSCLTLCSLLFSVMLSCAGCSSVEGYARDPEESSGRLASLEKYFDPSLDEQYFAEPNPTARLNLRNMIVANRMRAYDLAFDSFERGLISDSNSVSAGGSVIVTALGAIGATTGGLAAKSALNAASGAITGSQGIVNKELYFQKTVPALIAQMEAGRAKAKQNIILGLKQLDASYTLVQAYIDLEALKNAGGVPPAISAVTQDATDNVQAETDKLQVVSSSSFVFSASASRAELRAWAYPGGAPNQGRIASLVGWMRSHNVSESLAAFLSEAERETLRQQAIAELTRTR